ncbi:phage tail tape measure protein [Larkinella sp. GY13]|uniref:phage tail tape measure protein n=1 Tax=Larkinella sp. GY13 TaxID=3453720 RepID=UPI003EEF28FE
MAMDLNETASITLKIEGDAARNQLALLEGEARKLERALKEAPKGSQEWAELYKELGKNQDAQKVLRESVGLTGLTMKQLENESRSLTKELRNLTPGTEEFVAKSARLSEVNTRLGEVRTQAKGVSQALGETSTAVADWDDKNKRATLTVKQLREVADQLGKEIQDLVPGTKAHADAVAKQNEVQKQLGTTLAEQPSRWKQVQNAVVAFVGSFTLLSVVQELFSFIKSGISQALSLSDAMADVSKSTNMTAEQVRNLSEQLDQIDTRTAKEGLMEIAKVGGQLGIANDELLGFVESVDKAVVALGDEFTGGAEEAAKEIGALQKLFKETREMKAGDAINDIGSALNELGAAGSATAPVVADFTKRMGQLGDLSPQISETMGLGAAFQELGLTAEIAAGGLSNILLTAAKDTHSFAQQLGLTETQMKNLINTRPNEFLVKLAESFRGIPADQVAKRLAELGIKSQEATKVMSLMKDQTQLVTKYQDLANKAMKEGSSLTGEFNIKNKTAAAEYEKSQKAIALLATELGQSLLPYLTKSTQGVIAFVNIIRAVPEFLSENKTELALLGGALLAFNGHLIASTASSLAHAAAEKARIIWTESATAAQWLLNTALTANPIGAVIAVVMLLAAGFVTLYNNSVTVRAGINGLFEAMKVAAGELLNFWNAITSLNFAEAATIMWEGGKKIAAGFNKGYEDQIKTEQPKHLANHKTLVEQKKTVSVQGAKETGQLETLEDQKTHETKAGQARAAREKENAEIQKDTQAIIAKKREAQIAAIADENQREIAKLQWKHEQEVAAIQNSKARETEKTAAIKALDAQLKVDIEAENKKHLEKITADQQKALAMERELKLALETDEKARKLADAQYKYETEKARIEKEITDEVQQAQLLTLLKAKYTQDVAAINTEFRNRERESNNFIRTQEQAAEMAQFDWKELNAGNNAQKLIEIKRERLRVELDHQKANLAAERDAELARIAESNLSQEQKAAQQTAINAKYTADVALAGKQLESEMTRLDEEHVARKRERWQNYSNAFKSILDGDVASFTAAATQMFQVDEEHRNKKLQRTSEVADQVGDIAKQGVAFLNKLTQERLDKEIAASKKETETKLADNKTRMEAAIKAAEEQAEAEKLAAGDSAEEIERIETKLAESKTSIREDFESEADSIRKDGASKEKALAKQKWEADKKAQVATALISGAQAALKALASGIFPVNLVFAGIIAGLTALQIAKIKNQPAPSFARGGHFSVDEGQVKPMYGEGGIDWSSVPEHFGRMFRRGGKSYVKNAGVLQGARHGSRYGEKGIAMIDRESGREVGEAEGGEPFMILSRNTYSNNKPIIDRLLYSSMYRGGQKIAYRDGGVGSASGNWAIGTITETPYFERRMMLFGSKKKKEAENARIQAEIEARKAEEEAEKAAKDMASQSAYDGPTSGDEGDANGSAQASGYSGDAEAAAAEAAEMAQEQLDLLEDIGKAIESMSDDLQQALLGLSTSLTASMDNLAASNQTALAGLSTSLQSSINSMAGDVRELKGSINAVEGATREVKGAVDGVQGAVWGTNQAGRLDTLISAISSLG